MTEEVLREEEISLLSLGNTLLKNRWRILRWAGVGAVVAALSVISSPALFQASTSFVPQGNDGRSGLAGLAGQLGVTLPASNPALSPDFYVSLLRSRELLGHIVRDTVLVREMGNRRIALLDLFVIAPGVANRRQELGAKLLATLVSATADKKTGTVLVEVRTRWPSVSLHLVTALIGGVNEYNQRTRQTQAMAERKFLDGRLATAGADLRASEDRMEHFLQTNKQFSTSAQLSFENERLKRNLILQQQVFTSLTQAYEDARIREVRDTPAITMVESPSVRTEPEPRGRLKRVMLGFVLGGLVGVLLTFMNRAAANIRKEQNAEGELFLATLSEIKLELLGAFSRRNRQRGS